MTTPRSGHGNELASASETPLPRDVRVARAPVSARAWLAGAASLVVAAAMLTLGLGYYRCSRVNAEVQGTISEVSLIIGGARQDYGQYGYSGVTTAVAVGARVIPETRADGSGATATNGYGGAITLVDNSAKTAGTAILSYADVPAAQCAQIVDAVRPLTREIAVQGETVTRPDGRLAPARLRALCAAASGVRIDFVFGRR